MYLSGHNIDVLFFAVGEMQMKEEYDLICPLQIGCDFLYVQRTEKYFL